MRRPRQTLCHLALRHLALAAGLALAAPAAPVFAQAMNAAGSGQPVEILATDGIEWHRETQRYIARGSASARQGESTVYGDVLTAYYRSQPDGGTDIFRYEAQGHVRIVTPTQTAVGDKGVYDVDTGVVVLTGQGLKFTTPTDTITARDSLEYWDQKRIAVARGNAVAVSSERRMTGDVLTAHFIENKASPAPARPPRPGAKPQANGRSQPAATPVAATKDTDGMRLQRIEGFGNVHVSTATDIVRADRGVYNADTSIAMMSNNVRITRGQNQLDGDFAEVNLATGISRLLTRSDGTAPAPRVRALFVPDKSESKDKAAPPGGASAPRKESR
jgi:lipopolysaccharide export system protein LptA